MIVKLCLLLLSGFLSLPVANSSDVECGYTYAIAWVGCPVWPSNKASNPRILISNVFQACELVPLSYRGQLVGDADKKNLSLEILEKFGVKEDDFKLFWAVHPVNNREASFGSEVFLTKEEAIKKRAELIVFIEKSNTGDFPVWLSGYSLNTKRIDYFTY